MSEICEQCGDLLDEETLECVNCAMTGPARDQELNFHEQGRVYLPDELVSIEEEEEDGDDETALEDDNPPS